MGPPLKGLEEKVVQMRYFEAKKIYSPCISTNSWQTKPLGTSSKSSEAQKNNLILTKKCKIGDSYKKSGESHFIVKLL